MVDEHVQAIVDEAAALTNVKAALHTTWPGTSATQATNAFTCGTYAQQKPITITEGVRPVLKTGTTVSEF